MSSISIRDAIKMLARSNAPGTAVFDIVARALAEGFGCRWAGTAKFAQGTLSTGALVCREDAISFPVADTSIADAACGRLYERSGVDLTCVIRGDISAQFSNDPLVANRNICFFAASLFTDAMGNPAGHIFVMDDRALDDCARGDDAETRELLEIAGHRVGRELAAASAPAVDGAGAGHSLLRRGDDPPLCGSRADPGHPESGQLETSDATQRFRDFAEAATDWLWEMDENLRFCFLSDQFQNVTGVDPVRLLGKTRRQLLAGRDTVVDETTTDREWEEHIRVLEAHEPFQDFRHPRPAGDGRLLYLSISGKPIFAADGKFKGYRGTGRNITEQVRIENALRESERQLRLQSDRVEEASRAKSEFLANMSHEIRTPLNAILGFSDTMQREILGPVGSEKYLEYAAAIHASGRHLLELVNDVLDLSKIEAGRYVLSRRPMDLMDVVDGCLQITNETAHRKSIAITLDAPDALPSVNADPRGIKQVILNLLSNSLKYTDDGGRVTVSLQVQATDLVILVSDTGIGIPQADIATLTDAFVQGHSNQPYLTHEGTGLGLAITESIVTMHGGTVTIESTVGVGTIVRVHLPNAVELQKAVG